MGNNRILYGSPYSFIYRRNLTRAHLIIFLILLIVSRMLHVKRKVKFASIQVVKHFLSPDRCKKGLDSQMLFL